MGPLYPLAELLRAGAVRKPRAGVRDDTDDTDRSGGEDPGVDGKEKEAVVTLVWFVVWLICDLVGDRESLTFDPVNWWAGTLILVVALDLGRQHASGVPKRADG